MPGILRPVVELFWNKFGSVGNKTFWGTASIIAYTMLVVRCTHAEFFTTAPAVSDFLVPRSTDVLRFSGKNSEGKGLSSDNLVRADLRMMGEICCKPWIWELPWFFNCPISLDVKSRLTKAYDFRTAFYFSESQCFVTQIFEPPFQLFQNTESYHIHESHCFRVDWRALKFLSL